jgi:outer membrane immunogenic protein
VRLGYAVGGGLEWLFARDWSAKLEYLYYDLGSVTTPGTTIVGVSGAGVTQWAYAPTTSARFDGHVVRAGLNYHFNWAPTAPVLAKY